MSSRAELTALLVAGGLGSRMGTAENVPKPLIEVGGRTLLEWNLRAVLAAGATTVRFALRHEGERIERHLRSLADLPQERLHFLREERPLGTIGALGELNELDHPVLVRNGDLFTALDLSALLRTHRESGADLTLATHFERQQLRFGEILLDERGRVADYVEKPWKAYRLASGTNVVGPRALRLLERGAPLGFPELVQRALRAGLHVAEHLHDALWIDVNDPRDLALARESYRAEPARFEVRLP